MITLPIAWAILLLSCGPSAVLALFTLPAVLLTSFFILDEVFFSFFSFFIAGTYISTHFISLGNYVL